MYKVLGHGPAGGVARGAAMLRSLQRPAVVVAVTERPLFVLQRAALVTCPREINHFWQSIGARCDCESRPPRAPRHQMPLAGPSWALNVGVPLDRVSATTCLADERRRCSLRSTRMGPPREGAPGCFCRAREALAARTWSRRDRSCPVRDSVLEIAHLSTAFKKRA